VNTKLQFACEEAEREKAFRSRVTAFKDLTTTLDRDGQLEVLARLRNRMDRSIGVVTALSAAVRTQQDMGRKALVQTLQVASQDLAVSATIERELVLFMGGDV
jgi:hypothetical protein